MSENISALISNHFHVSGLSFNMVYHVHLLIYVTEVLLKNLAPAGWQSVAWN